MEKLSCGRSIGKSLEKLVESVERAVTLNIYAHHEIKTQHAGLRSLLLEKGMLPKETGLFRINAGQCAQILGKFLTF